TGEDVEGQAACVRIVGGPAGHRREDLEAFLDDALDRPRRARVARAAADLVANRLDVALREALDDGHPLFEREGAPRDDALERELAASVLVARVDLVAAGASDALVARGAGEEDHRRVHLAARDAARAVCRDAGPAAVPDAVVELPGA